MMQKDKQSRRSILKAGLVAPGAIGLLADMLPTKAMARSGRISFGDASILRFLAAMEILETDLWEQYNEIYGIQDHENPPAGQVLGGTGNVPYTAAIQVLDPDMSQYIHDNTEDEFSHFTFINEYLESKDAESVSLEHFRKLPGSTAPGSSGKRRLTNLMQLNVDTSYWTRYRSRTGNPDFGDIFAPVVPGLLATKADGTPVGFPAIPRSPADMPPNGQVDDHTQAIANTAGFHFGFIEQGGSSLYPQLAQRVSSVEVLRILLSIGPTETMHFQVWHDKAGNAPGVTDPTNGLMFPDFTKKPILGNEDLQANLIMPEPTKFLSPFLPVCSIIRPTETHNAATNAFNGLRKDGLFNGQEEGFFTTMLHLAAAADMAQREV